MPEVARVIVALVKGEEGGAGEGGRRRRAGRLGDVARRERVAGGVGRGVRG